MEATGDIQRYQLQVDSGDPVEPSADYSGQSWKLLGVCLVRLTSLRFWDKGEMWCLGIWVRHEKPRMVLEVAGVAVTISYSDGVRVLA